MSGLGLWSFPVLLAAALLPRAAHAKVVGIGIAKSNNHVYAWFDDGTVSSGNSGNFALYSHPAGFSLPENEQPKDILALSIAKNNHVYAWYRDGMTSEGTSGNLGKYKGLTPFQPAAGKSVADIRAIGITGSNNRIYAWYADGTVSVGTSGRLDAYHAATGVQLPPGKTMADVVEIDIASDDRVYSWFTDGTFYIGTSGALAKHDGPGGYRSRMVLHADYKPGPHLIKLPPHPFFVAGEAGEAGEGRHSPIHVLPPGTIGNAPEGDVSFREIGLKSTATLVGLVPNPAIGGPDPMVAVSPRFMIISDSEKLIFADRKAVQLRKIANGLETNIESRAFFHQFFDGDPANNINLNAGFSADCATFPRTTGQGFCLGAVYDTRAFFDGETGRFFILAQTRNELWVDFSSSSKWGKAHPGSCGYFEAPKEGAAPSCVPLPDKVKCPISDRKLCGMARRYMLLAVSKSEDPRDGFFQFAVTENIVSDFPWMAINHNRVVLGHQDGSPQPPQATEKHPVVLVFDKSALLAGSTQPPFFGYWPDDLSGEAVVMPVTQPIGERMTLLLHGGSDLRIFGFKNSSDPWKAPPLIKASTTIEDAPGALGAVHRQGRLYLVGASVAQEVPNPADPEHPFQRRSVHLVRVPVSLTADDILISKSASAGFLDYHFGFNSPEDPPQARFSYEKPSIAVNRMGDMLFGYHRRPFPHASDPPDARVSFWPATATAPFASQRLKSGTGEPGGAQSDYSTTVVDLDDLTFWTAQSFGVAGNWSTVIGNLTP